LANDEVTEPELEPTAHDEPDLGTAIDLKPIVGVKYSSPVYFYLLTAMF
jgi:hypothetical protein